MSDIVKEIGDFRKYLEGYNGRMLYFIKKVFEKVGYVGELMLLD